MSSFYNTAVPKRLEGAMKDVYFSDLWARAKRAGLAAGNAITPRPMVVGTPTTPFGNDIDMTKPQYYISEGLCGFAWVNVKPGNSRFANWLKRHGHARSDSYYGGVTIWISEHGQSYERKVKHAGVLAAVLREGGIEAHAADRLD